MNHNLKETYSIKPFFNAFEKKLVKYIGPKETPLILIQGGYGKHNTGDDTLLLVAVNQTLKVYPKANVIALCHDPRLIQESYNIKSVAFKSIHCIEYLFRCDALIIAAGGLANNIDYNSKLRSIFNLRGKFVLFSLLLTIFRRRCSVIFGVGIHEIPDFIVKNLLKFTVPKASLIAVRDKHTVQYLKEIGVDQFFFCHDPALVYQKRNSMDWVEFCKTNKITSSKLVMLNYRNVKNVQLSERVIAELSIYIREFNNLYPGYQILFIPFSIHPTFELENDVIAMHKLIKTIQRGNHIDNLLLIEEYQTADFVKEIASHCEMLILSRHHAAVLTYECQKPTIILSYNFKCREFGELGEYLYIIDYENITHRQLLSYTNEILNYQEKKELEL